MTSGELHRESRTRLPVANVVFAPSSPVPFADGDLPVAFSSPLVGAHYTALKLRWQYESYSLKKQNPPFQVGLLLAGVGLAFRSPTSCVLPTGRFRSLTATSLSPFPPPWSALTTLRVNKIVIMIFFKIKKLPYL